MSLDADTERAGSRSSLARGVPNRVLIALAVMALLVPVAVAQRLSARIGGTEILLRVQPVDPIDPFRGAYVDLGYPDLARSLPRDPSSLAQESEVSTARGSSVYVPLTAQGPVHVGGAALAQRPSSGLFIKCVEDWRLRCGIESYFAPQDKARDWQDAIRGSSTVTARVRVDRWGNAVLVGLVAGSP